MAKVYMYVHPNPPKVGDEVDIYEIEVPTEADAERLEGVSFPAPSWFMRP